MLRPGALFLMCLMLDAQVPMAVEPGLPAWLSGCWQLTRGTVTVEEQWLAPRGGMMLAAGRTVRGEVVLEFEFAVLRATDAGLSYEAHPQGQPPATFKVLTHDPAVVVFENPTHDFPQRVGYRRTHPDSVLAWIEGRTEGQLRRIEFPYHRVDCRFARP